MNISFDSIIFGLQHFGGISTYWQQMLRYAGQHPDVEGEAVLPEPLISGLDLFAELAPLEKARDPRKVAIARYLAAPRTDYAIQHTSYYRSPASRRTRSVVTVYDFIYERYRDGLARKVHEWQKSRALHRADAILSISASTRDDLLNRYPKIDPARVIVTHLAHDRSVFRPLGAGESLRPELAHTVLFVGQRGGYKRFDIAIEAIRASRDLSLVIIGPPLDPHEEQALERSVPGRWRHGGSVHNDELRILYANCLALIYPSDYEGFGLPVLEAMACGAPVVCARVSSIPEVGRDAAFYAGDQSGDAYAQQLATLMDRETQAEARAASLANSTRFSWQRCFEETAQVYRDLSA